MNSIFHYCQGESHKSTDKPCQDCAYAEHSDTLSMAIVCDGHGGERYFRSQYGSMFAVEIIKESIHTFVESQKELASAKDGINYVFANASFTAYSAASASVEQQESKAHNVMMRLFSSIISQWNIAITKDAIERDLTEWELEHVEEKYREEFLQKRQNPDSTFEKTYGCTIMAYVQTPDYWLAFHLGDGKFLSMHVDEDQLVCEQPIPWDERCFLNKTTSICDSDALSEFRYCYQGNGQFPLAVFLGSDGMDDSYGDGDNLTNFYIQLYKQILKHGNKDAKKELVKSLPIISARGSKDDMSVASIYNDGTIVETFNLLINRQEKMNLDLLDSIKEKIHTLEDKIESMGDPESLDRAHQINLEYAKKDLVKVKDQEVRITRKISALRSERTKFNKKHNI